MAAKPLTKFDVSIAGAVHRWIVLVRKRIDSEWATYEQAEARWAELTSRLPAYRG